VLNYVVQLGSEVQQEREELVRNKKEETVDKTEEIRDFLSTDKYKTETVIEDKVTILITILT
jgi:hypothetical protein